MKNTLKFGGLLLTILTVMSCSSSISSDCYSFTYEETVIKKETDFEKAYYKVHYRDESVSGD